MRPRPGARAGHLALGEGEVFLQVAADAKSVRAAGQNDAPDVIVFLGFVPCLVERPIEISTDRVLFLRAVELDDRDMGIALLVNTQRSWFCHDSSCLRTAKIKIKKPKFS